MTQAKDLDYNDAASLFKYDEASGVLRWLSDGSIAGRLRSSGYILVFLRGRRYPVHRIAWTLCYGAPPTMAIDHVNGERSDNRMTNLRLATNVQNQGNSKRRRDNKTGAKGVFIDRGIIRAHIKINGKMKHLGCFYTVEEAAAAYACAANDHFGEFARAA